MLLFVLFLLAVGLRSGFKQVLMHLVFIIELVY